MDRRAARAALRRVAEGLGAREVVWRDRRGREVGRMAEDRALVLFLDAIRGDRLPDGLATALAGAEPGDTDMTALPVLVARGQMGEETVQRTEKEEGR